MGFEDAVVADGTESGEVEGAANGAATAGDMAFALEGAAVAVVGGDTDQGGESLIAQSAQFWEFGHQGCGDDRADPWHQLEAVGLGAQSDILSEEACDLGSGGLDLGANQTNQLGALTAQEGVGVVGRAVGFAHQGLLELAAALDQSADAFGQWLWRRCWTGTRGGPELGDDGRVDGIVFGTTAAGTGVVADATGLDNADGEVCGPEGADGPLLVATGGFADEVDAGVFFEEPDEAGMARLRVREVLLLAGQMQG